MSKWTWIEEIGDYVDLNRDNTVKFIQSGPGTNLMALDMSDEDYLYYVIDVHFNVSGLTADGNIVAVVDQGGDGNLVKIQARNLECYKFKIYRGFAGKAGRSLRISCADSITVTGMVRYIKVKKPGV